MKKFLYTLSFLFAFGTIVKSQTPNDFDKKFRFGLRITPQPTWLSSNDKNNTPNGGKFGFGFGLNMEFKFSDIASLLTGVGGDFEGGKYRVKYDPANSYQVQYWQNESGEFFEPKSGKKIENTVYFLKERNIKSSFITFPVILKLSTKEYNGFKYFGMFGGELGFRLKGSATDTYYKYGKYTTDSTFVALSATESSESSLNITNELYPVRVAFNAGAGAEYRLGGTTCLFASINFFRSMTPYLYKESSYLYYRTDRVAGGESYRFVKQALVLNAIKINIGIMF